MFETSDLNTIKTLLANKPESVRLLEVDDNSISKRIKDIKKIAIEKKLKIEEALLKVKNIQSLLLKNVGLIQFKRQKRKKQEKIGQIQKKVEKN